MDRKSVSLLAAAAMLAGYRGTPIPTEYSIVPGPRHDFLVPIGNGGRGPGRGHPRKYTYTRKNKNSSRARCMGRR